MKKIIYHILLLAIFINQIQFTQSGLTRQVYAQESSNSATLIKEYEPLDDTSAFNTLTLDETIQPLTKLKEKKRVIRLAKRNFQAKEKIQFVIKNTTEKDEIKFEITNENSPDIKAKIEKTDKNGDVIFTINPEVGMEPGLYKVKITDSVTGEVMSEQDFLWGVLAINTYKSIYLPGEQVHIAMGVLDQSGHMVCDALVRLEITSPTGNVFELSTQNGKVKVNRECLLHEVTEIPDYEAYFAAEEIGRYNMTLTATTRNGSYSVKDRFEVRKYVPFDIERNTATRLFPPNTYPVTIKIKANESFRGKIVESVPQEFQISAGPEGTVGVSEEKTLQESINPQSLSTIPELELPFEGEHKVSLGFGQQIDGHGMENTYKKYGLDGHDGIDFDMPEGTAVLSVWEGEVVLAEKNWAYGHTVVIDHAWGKSYYGHLSEIEVTKGQKVGKGTQVGLSGSTGLDVTGPHLHFSMKPKIYDMHNLYYGKVDPAPFFGLYESDETLSNASYPISSKVLVWNVDIKKGDEITLGYSYNAPLRFPYFYTLGPLQFLTSDIPVQVDELDAIKNPLVLGEATSSAEILPEKSLVEKTETVEKVIFSEIRTWQIAADADTTVVLDANADGTCGSGCWTVPSDWTDVNTIYAIGGGGAGDNLSTGGGGGGGGAFARITNLDLTAGGSITFGVGAGGTDAVNGGTTWFNAADAASCTSSATCVKAAGGTTATNATGGAGGSIAGTNSVGTTRFAGGSGGNGSATGDDSTGGGGGAGSPNGTGGTGGAGDGSTAGEEAHGGGGGSGCDSIGASNDGTQGGTNGGKGGDSCFATGGIGGIGPFPGYGDPGTNGSGGGGGDASGASGGNGGDGIGTSDPSLAGGGGGGSDELNVGGASGGDGGFYGGGGGGSSVIGTGAGGVIVIVYTIPGPTLLETMRHGKWFSSGAEQPFTF